MLYINDIKEKEKFSKYLQKKTYNTIEILKDPSFKLINMNVKDFLLNLTFETKGLVKNEIIFSSYDDNEKHIEDFFSYLNDFIPNSREKFINTKKENGVIKCDISSSDPDEQIKSIKKFILEKYENMYKNMRDRKGNNLIKKSGLIICPYCHRSYIGIIESNETSKTISPDLDHLYPKSKYPFLSVTLSNLIPSCLFCNQRAKNDIDFYVHKITNPPNKIFDIIEFDHDPISGLIFISNYYDLIKNPKYKIQLETFLIQETYASHKEILFNLINKVYKYRKSNIEDISRYAVGINLMDIEKVVFYEYEFLNKETELLYKLKYDLYQKIVKAK